MHSVCAANLPAFRSGGLSERLLSLHSNVVSTVGVSGCTLMATDTLRAGLQAFESVNLSGDWKNISACFARTQPGAEDFPERSVVTQSKALSCLNLQAH